MSRTPAVHADAGPDIAVILLRKLLCVPVASAQVRGDQVVEDGVGDEVELAPKIPQEVGTCE